MSEPEKKRKTFKENFIDLFKSGRVWLLIIFLLLSVVAINWNFDSGVVINGVVPGSSADNSGIDFKSSANPTNYEKVLTVNGEEVNNEAKFYQLLDKYRNVTLVTDKNSEGYQLTGVDNASSYGISVRDAPKSNIRLGIELEGGSRLILKPKKNLTTEEFDTLVENLQSRLNVYGASGTKVSKLEDVFSGESFVVVESISANKNDIYSLISKQGKFEAYLGNESVFTGEDIITVFRDPQHTRLEGCSDSAEGKVCTYAFSIEINSEAGGRFLDAAKDLETSNGQLGKNIFFYLDEEEFTNLTVSSSFKYQKITNPQITVSGDPQLTRKQAIDSAQNRMEEMQAILSTSALPSKLDVVQSYSISSSRGETLLKNAAIVGLTALLVVAAVVALRYRKVMIFAGIFTALVSEVIIVLGISAFMNLSIDLAAIGGLIAAIGTGVDDQIIITDEYFRKKSSKLTSKNRVKKAIAIILVAYVTTLAAMLPLYFAGLQILKGFAFMIVIGVTVGVLVTRPFYASMLRIFMTSREERQEEDKE